MHVYVSMATNADDVGVQLFIDDKAITDTLLATKGEDWSTYASVSANVTGLTAGEHVLKMVIVGNYVNIDYLNFVSGKDAPETDTTTLLRTAVRLTSPSVGTYGVYSLNGRFLGRVTTEKNAASQELRRRGFGPSVYLLREVHGGKTFMVNIAK